MSRAHHTAWPRPSGALLAREAGLAGAGQGLLELVEFRLLATPRQCFLKFHLLVEMILDHALVAACDEDEMLDAGLARLVDDVLDHGPVDDRQHFLRHGLGGGEETGSKTRDGKDGLANALHVQTSEPETASLRRENTLPALTRDLADVTPRRVLVTGR